VTFKNQPYFTKKEGFATDLLNKNHCEKIFVCNLSKNLAKTK